MTQQLRNHAPVSARRAGRALDNLMQRAYDLEKLRREQPDGLRSIERARNAQHKAAVAAYNAHWPIEQRIAAVQRGKRAAAEVTS